MTPRSFAEAFVLTYAVSATLSMLARGDWSIVAGLICGAAIGAWVLYRYLLQTEDEPPETEEVVPGVTIAPYDVPELERRMAESAADPAELDDEGYERWMANVEGHPGDEDPNNATHHRVYIPGPHGAGHAYVIDHPPTCTARPCNTQAQLAWNALRGIEYQVQGEYFTVNGVSYVRCAWQPTMRCHPWMLRTHADGSPVLAAPQLPQGRGTDCPPRTWRSRLLDLAAAPQNWIYR